MNHPHIFGVGNRQVRSSDLHMLRYDVPRMQREHVLSPSRYLLTAKPRAPVVRYQMLTPTDPVGPLDIVTIPIVLHPLDPAVVVRSISLVVERRIELSETSVLPSRASPLSSPLFTNEEEDSSNSTIRPKRDDGEVGSSSTLGVRREVLRHQEIIPDVSSRPPRAAC